MTRDELIQSYIDRMDNELGLGDGSGVGFPREHLARILNDFASVVEEQFAQNNL